jgi:glutamate-1-semialdehyde 2,1-aminomutase
MKRSLRRQLEAKIATSLEWQRRGARHLASFHTTGPIGPPPWLVYVARASGARIVDVDGHEYVDLSAGYGPAILGHSPPEVIEAIREAAGSGLVHGLGNPLEIELAELIVELMPGVDRVAFTNSGTEATLHALKIARALTGRDRVAKFEGAYHGTHDQAQISGRSAAWGPAEAPESRPNFAGISRAAVADTLTLSYGHPAALARIEAEAETLAAVIVEPVPTCCPIDFSEFLRALRAVTERAGVVLIFDEVMSGFRMGLSGAQGVYGIRPDLTTLGKVLGGGLPVGAIVGTEAAMQPLVTSGQAVADLRSRAVITGTFSGNPITCAAGLATLRRLRGAPEIYARMEGHAARIRREVEAHADAIGFPLRMLGVSSWLLPVFDTRAVHAVRDVDFRKSAGEARLLALHLLLHGVILGDVPVLFPGAAHTDADIDQAIAALKAALDELR